MSSMQDFYLNYVLNVFDEAGLQDLNPEQRQMHGAEFALQLEREIGNTLVPQLSIEHMAEFVELVDDAGVTVEKWSQFWHEAIPNFDEQIENILESFRQEITSLFA